MRNEKPSPELDYRAAYEEILAWVQEDEHIVSSRDLKNHPEYAEAVFRAAAAIIALINSHAEIPAGDWLAALGQHALRPDLWRGSFTINVNDLRRITGIKEVPRPAEILIPGQTVEHKYVTVIWQRNVPDETLSIDRITPSNLCTAYPLITVDRVMNPTQKEYRWAPLGRRAEQSDLTNQILAKLYGQNK